VATRDDIQDVGDGGSEVVDGYEQLRLRALRGDADGWRLGLAVLQQRGLAAWLRVRQAAVAATHPASTPARSAPSIGGSVDAEVVRLLASMALAVAAQG
jgi:hypothetical protein